MNLIGKVTLGGVIATGVLATGLGSYHFYKTPTTIGQVLWKEKGLKLLKDNEKWEELAKKYVFLEGDQDGGGLRRIDSLTLGGTSTYGSTENPKKLREKCASLWDTKLSELNDEGSRERIEEDIKNWCISNAKNLNNQKLDRT